MSMCIDSVRECTGCQRCYDAQTVYCPICGAENPRLVYSKQSEDCIGCEDCVGQEEDDE